MKSVYVETWECATCEEPCTVIARRSQYYGHRPQTNADGNWKCLCTVRQISDESVSWKLISFLPAIPE